jgi:hypothetical protein
MQDYYTIDITGRSGWNSSLYYEDRESVHKYLISAYELVLIGAISRIVVYYRDVVIHETETYSLDQPLKDIIDSFNNVPGDEEYR